MNASNNFLRLWRRTGAARFIVLFGIALIVFGIIMMSFNTDSYQQTTGTITSVVECPRLPDESESYDVGVSYTVDGTRYENTFSGLLGEYQVGESMKVFYDPADPNVISNARLGIIPLIILGVGVLTLLFGVWKAIRAIRTL